MNDLTFVAPHRISSAQFARVLERAHSPAAPDAAALADIPTDYGIDRAVALAFFAHESSFGTQGICASEDTKNWGNVRRPYSASAAELITPPGRGPFAKYPTWIAGLDDWCKRIRYTYVEAWKLATVGAALARYAPTTDHNDPARYAAAAAQLVAQWQAEDTSPMLLKLAITDLRAKLPRKNWEIGRRHGNHPTSITLHYNGSKPVPPERQRGEGVLTQLKIDSRLADPRGLVEHRTWRGRPPVPPDHRRRRAHLPGPRPRQLSLHCPQRRLQRALARHPPARRRPQTRRHADDVAELHASVRRADRPLTAWPTARS